MPDFDMTLSYVTLFDVDRLPKLKMTDIETGSSGRRLEFL